MLLQGLLARGHKVSFFTKPSFVDPRASIDQEYAQNLTVVDCTNHFEDGLRRKMSPSGRGLWGAAWGTLDSASYNRGVVRAMRRCPNADIDLWLGDWARGRGSRPVVSFVQGPPGTDADSVEKHKQQIVELVGRPKYEQLRLYARYRLTQGLPSFAVSDHVIVGSRWSKRAMVSRYGFKADAVSTCPYPIDLEQFQPSDPRPAYGRLRVLWLGRFVPRKRLDVFLQGLEISIQNGIDAEGWIVGSSGFVPGYERLIAQFPFQDRIRTWPSIPRKEVATLLADVDVLAQPSDDENFGSSVAEALACGVPAIVGATNGTGDYICEHSISLGNDSANTFAIALARMSQLKQDGALIDRSVSRCAAEKWFDPAVVIDRLEETLLAVANRCCTSSANC